MRPLTRHRFANQIKQLRQNGMNGPNSLSTETNVKDRYGAAAKAREAALCCPVEYNQDLLKIIPSEVIEKDYGCGDPSQFLHTGETVLDLGSGTGKICFIAAQVVGPKGRVIGVDMTDDMLEVARRNQPLVAEQMGYDNVEFRKGRIQDLGLDLDRLDQRLNDAPIASANAYLKAQDLADELRIKHPLIVDASIDTVVSNCVLNLVDPRAKRQLFDEIYRVIRPGGRAVISDIVSDEPIPESMQQDPELWSGCISGALTEMGFIEAFERAGFYGMTLRKRDAEPWQTVEGIEFRSVTIEAFKGDTNQGLECNQAAIYLGPFKKVLDDEGRWFERGQRHSVSDQTFERIQQAPFNQDFAVISPKHEIDKSSATPFEQPPGHVRGPRATKGQNFRLTTPPSDCCEPNSGSCC